MRTSPPRPPTTRRWSLLTLLVAACWLLLPAVQASAHAVLISQEPAAAGTVKGDAPTQVVLHFSEPVKIRFGGIRVFDNALKRVDKGQPRFKDEQTVVVDLEPIADGSYVVAWRVVSADTHPVRGAFPFVVNKPSPAGADSGKGRLDQALNQFGSAPKPVLVAASAARTLGYMTALLLFGTLAFLLLAWRPGSPGGDADRGMVRSAGRLLLRVWPVAALASVLILTTEASNEAGVSLGKGLLPSNLGPVLTSTLGKVWIVRMVLLLLLLPLLLRLAKTPAPAARSVGAMAASAETLDKGAAHRTPPAGRPQKWLAALLAGGVAVTPAFWGHAVTSRHRAVSMLADSTHLLSVSAWIGGLVVLLFLVPRVLKDADPGERAEVLARTVPRFSKIALCLVGLLIASGTYLAIQQVGTWEQMIKSTYGKVLTAKIIGLALALALAAVNLFRTQRHLRATAEQPEESAVWARRLRRAVGGEAMVTTVVVVLASVLVSLAPPRGAGAGGTTPGANSGQYIVDRIPVGPDLLAVTVYPTRPGEDAEIHTQYTTPDGRADDTIVEVDVSLTLVDKDLGPFRYPTTRLAPGHYIAQGFTFPASGTWSLELTARQGEFDEFRHVLEFPVG